MELYNNFVRPILEGLYFLASIGLFAGVLVGIRQFKLMKKEYEVNNKRASVEKSIEYLNLFATEFIPKIAEVFSEIHKSNIKFYKGPINEEFKFDKNCNLGVEYVRKNLVICMRAGADDILNRFEYFSAALISGLADEELAFNPLAQPFCEVVEKLYIPLCYTRREEGTTSFSNTVKLYNIWKKRLQKANLERKKSKLDEQISKIEEERIQEIWK